MRIKNKEWVNFKVQFMDMLSILGEESDKFDIPIEDDNFEICVDECVVHPTFVKKIDYLRVEYDLTLCNTKIRAISFTMYKDSGRIELSLKDDELLKRNI